jgi:hypothetical protein
MKNIFTFLFIFFFSFSFSQNTVELDMSSKDYKKILKKLDLKVTNRGYDASGPIFVKVSTYDAAKRSIYADLWNEALFEMGMPVGNITEQTSESVTIDADWIFQLEGSVRSTYAGGQSYGGGFSGKILDFTNNNKMVATFTTKEKMNFTAGLDNTEKRAEKFKQIVKVIVNEILLTIK